MCEPTTIALAASAGASALAGAGTAYSQHQAQKQLEKRAASKADQMAAQAVSKDFERTRKAMQDKARIQALAGVGGVQGQSVNAQVADAQFQRSYDAAGIQYNLGRGLENLNYQADAQARRIGSPANTLLQTGLNIGKTAASHKLGE